MTYYGVAGYSQKPRRWGIVRVTKAPDQGRTRSSQEWTGEVNFKTWDAAVARMDQLNAPIFAAHAKGQCAQLLVTGEVCDQPRDHVHAVDPIERLHGVSV